MHPGCWQCPEPQPATQSPPGRKGELAMQACVSTPVGSLPRLRVQHPHPLSPLQQLLGGGSPILSTSCPLGPLPTPIRGVALDQAGQVACKPGAGSGPDRVSENQLGLTNSRCRVAGRGSPPVRGMDPPGGLRLPTAVSPVLGSLQVAGAQALPPPWLPLVWTLSLAFSPDYPLQPPLPGSQDTCPPALRSSPLLLHTLCPLPVLPSVQSMTNASTIRASQSQAGAPLFSGMGATEKALYLHEEPWP